MRKVLHYKTNYLNTSETFIDRLVRNHQDYEPAALCYRRKAFTDGLNVFQPPANGFDALINLSAFHLNLTLPYYYSIAKSLKPDILHSHFGFDAVKMMKLAASLKLPHIVSFYGSDVSRLPLEFRWQSRYHKLACLGTIFIAATDLMVEQLEDLGFPKDKIRKVHFGLDMDLSAFHEEYRCSPDLMMVGRMVEKKGFEYAIHAVSKLHKSGIAARLNIYGDGPLMGYLVRLTAELSLGDYVFFHGFKPVEEILEAHTNHSLLIAPSVTAPDGDMEGLPNTILEAMVKGTPVVATRHAAIPEVIVNKETGFLVEERDPDALAAVLVEILAGSYNLDLIRKNARHKVEQEYGINQTVRQVEQIYAEAILDSTAPVKQTI